MSNRRLVLFLGAGFSKPFGLPNTSELWDLGLLESETSKSSGLLLQAAYKDYPINHFITTGIRDVELLLTAWDSWLEFLYRHFPDTDGHPRAHYEHYITNLAMHLDERTFAIKDSALAPVTEFIHRAQEENHVTVITTNYDRIPERVFAQAKLRPTYLSEAGGQVPLYKLHGSVNWATFKQQPVRLMDNWKPLLLDQLTDFGVYDFGLEPFAWVASRGWPLLIPPVIRKEYTDTFAKVFRGAAAALRSADRVLMLGYSFPPADIVIERLVETTTRRTPAPLIRFVNPASDAIARARALLATRAEFFQSKWEAQDLEWLLS